MSLLDNIKRRAVASRAAQYLRDKDAEWTEGYWLWDTSLDPGEKGAQLDAQSTIGQVREWLREKNFGSRFANKRCRTAVCAEGALLLALAADQSVPDSVIAADVLKEFQEPAKNAALEFGWVDEYSWVNIHNLNDTDFSETQAVTLLDRMAQD